MCSAFSHMILTYEKLKNIMSYDLNEFGDLHGVTRSSLATTQLRQRKGHARLL